MRTPHVEGGVVVGGAGVGPWGRGGVVGVGVIGTPPVVVGGGVEVIGVGVAPVVVIGGVDVPSAVPGVGAPPVVPGVDAPPVVPGVGAHPVVPGVGAPPVVPGVDAPPVVPGVVVPGFGVPVNVPVAILNKAQMTRWRWRVRKSGPSSDSLALLTSRRWSRCSSLTPRHTRRATSTSGRRRRRGGWKCFVGAAGLVEAPVVLALRRLEVRSELRQQRHHLCGGRWRPVVRPATSFGRRQ